MKRIVISTIFTFIALASGWYFVPNNIKSKTLAFVGAAVEHDSGEIKNIFKDAVLPENPEEKREILIQELKKNLKEIKEAAILPPFANQKLKSAGPPDKNIASKIKELISSSESAIEKLEEANDDKSVIEKITERVIEIILPDKETDECVPAAK